MIIIKVCNKTYLWSHVMSRVICIYVTQIITFIMIFLGNDSTKQQCQDSLSIPSGCTFLILPSSHFVTTWEENNVEIKQTFVENYFKATQWRRYGRESNCALPLTTLTIGAQPSGHRTMGITWSAPIVSSGVHMQRGYSTRKCLIWLTSLKVKRILKQFFF